MTIRSKLENKKEILNPNYKLWLDGQKPKFDKFKEKAIQILKEDGEKITPESILSLQEGLACDEGIIPPHWTGWIECEKCGVMAAEPTYKGDKVKTCRWCFTQFGGAKLRMDAEDPRWAGHCAVINEGKRKANEEIPLRDAQDSEWYLEENIQQLTPDEDLEGFL